MTYEELIPAAQEYGVSISPELQEKLNNLAKENSKDFNQQAAALLSGAGIEISVDDLKVPTDELSEDELMAISGGGGPWWLW